MTEAPIGSRSPLRREDERLLLGNGNFVGDANPAGTLHAAFVRSPIAHGRLDSVDTAEAKAVAGVVAVLTIEDLALADLPPPLGLDRPDVIRPHLARDRVRYVGEPIAVVIAESGPAAADGAELVWPEIEELPVVMSSGDDDSEPHLFEDSNVLARSTVRSESRSRVADDAHAQVTTHNQRLAPLPVEGLTILCVPGRDGGLTVTLGSQAPHRHRTQLAAALGLDAGQVRVVVPDVGGGFGLKNVYFTEYGVVAAAALRLGRPIMWLERRREHLAAGIHGRSMTVAATVEGDGRGRIGRLHVEIDADVGAYPQTGFLMPSLTRFLASGLYAIDDVTADLTISVTNRAPTGSYRGAGRPEAAYAIERAVDAYARACGLDPAEVRRTNLISKESLPYSNHTGATYDTGDYRAALDAALELAEVENVRVEQQDRLAARRNPLGLGIGAFIERAGGAADSGEFGDVELTPQGIVVRTGSTAAGQGHNTVWSQMLAQVFDVEMDDVTVIAGDTGEVADGIGTYGSRSAQTGAAAAYRMSLAVLEDARNLAADMLEAAPADVVLSSGAFHVSGVPGTDLSLKDIAAEAQRRSVPLRHHEMFVPGIQTFPYGVYVAVVEVDLDTGEVEVVRVVAVDDCGNVLNPMVVLGQLHGSFAQGLGQALYEGVSYSESGDVLTSTMMDYTAPRAADIPPIITDRLVHPAPSNPLGVKGTGETGCIGAPPAIVNAVLDALRPYGVTDLQMPLRPQTVWQALQDAKS